MNPLPGDRVVQECETITGVTPYSWSVDSCQLSTQGRHLISTRERRFSNEAIVGLALLNSKGLHQYQKVPAFVVTNDVRSLSCLGMVSG